MNNQITPTNRSVNYLLFVPVNFPLKTSYSNTKEREVRLETIIRDLVSQVDALTNTLLALEQRVTFIEDHQKENMCPGNPSRSDKLANIPSPL